MFITLRNSLISVTNSVHSVLHRFRQNKGYTGKVKETGPVVVEFFLMVGTPTIPVTIFEISCFENYFCCSQYDTKGLEMVNAYYESRQYVT